MLYKNETILFRLHTTHKYDDIEPQCKYDNHTAPYSTEVQFILPLL